MTPNEFDQAVRWRKGTLSKVRERVWNRFLRYGVHKTIFNDGYFHWLRLIPQRTTILHSGASLQVA